MIRCFRGVAPRIAASALVTPIADVLGDVLLADGAARWAGTVLRGDVHWRAVVLDGAVVDAGAEATGRPVLLT